MDELEILIQAILSLKDTTKSKQQILSELPKLQQQLQSDKNARINVTAGIDISKSKSLIQSQLNTLAAQTKAPIIKVGIDVKSTLGNNNHISQATQSIKEYNHELRETTTIQSQISNRNYTSDNSVFLGQIQTLKSEKTAVDDLVTAFNNYGIAVKNVTSTEARSEKGTLNGLTVSIQSATGEIERFKYAAEKANGQTVLVLKNITATDSAVQRLVQSQAQYNDQLNASATKLQSQLDNIKRSAYIGSRPTMARMQANANAEISTLKQMVAEVKNAEYAATQLRSKDIGTIKNIETGHLDKFINQINNSKVPMEAMKQDIDNLKASLSSISKENPKSLTDFLNQLDIAKSKFASLKEFYKSIDTYDSELDKMATAWKRQGIPIDEIHSKITALKNELKQVAGSGNTAELTAWIENYNKALSGMNVNSEKQAQLNNYLNEQVRLTKTILSLQTQIATINPNRDENKLSALRQTLSARQQELAVLRQENSSMTELMSAEQQQKHILEQTSREQERLLIAQQRAVDIERRSEAVMQRKAENLRTCSESS